MKIAHLTSVHRIDDPRIFHKQCQSLVQRGFHVSLIAQHNKQECIDGVNVIGIGFAKNRWQRMFVLPYRIYKALKQQKIKVCHFHDFELIFLGLWLKCLGYKVIYDVHEDTPEDIKVKTYLPKWVRTPLAIFAKGLEKIAGKCFDRIVTVTPHIAQRFPKKKTALVRNFPILKEFTISSDYNQRAPNAVYIGGLNYQRGLDTMLAVSDQIQQDFTLHLAGSLQPVSLLEEINAKPDAIYHGFLSRLQINHLLNEQRLGLLLLKPLPTFKESYPLKLFEYMAAGLPVVAADFPLWRTIIEKADCGLLVDPLDEESIIESIRYLLHHQEQAYQLGQNGRKAVEKYYCWQQEVATLVGLYGASN